LASALITSDLDTLINDLLEKVRLLEDKVNEEDDVGIFFFKSNCRDLNKTDPNKEHVDYQLISCSKCKFKYICYNELKMHKSSKHTLFNNLE
jgi:hypothetical protein